MYTDLLFDTLFYSLHQPYKATLFLNNSLYRDHFLYPVSYTKTSDNLDVYIQAPGLKPESIEVQVDGDSINVKALTRVIPGFNYEPGEMSKKLSTKHIFTLNPDTTKVEYQDGILHIYVEKLESEKPKCFKLSSLSKVETETNSNEASSNSVSE